MARGVLRAGLNRLSQLLLFGEGDAEIGDRYEGAEQYRRRQAEFDRGHAPLAIPASRVQIPTTRPPGSTENPSMSSLIMHSQGADAARSERSRVRYVSVVRTVPAVEYHRFGFFYCCPFP